LELLKNSNYYRLLSWDIISSNTDILIQTARESHAQAQAQNPNQHPNWKWNLNWLQIPQTDTDILPTTTAATTATTTNNQQRVQLIGNLHYLINTAALVVVYR